MTPRVRAEIEQILIASERHERRPSTFALIPPPPLPAPRPYVLSMRRPERPSLLRRLVLALVWAGAWAGLGILVVGPWSAR